MRSFNGLSESPRYQRDIEIADALLIEAMASHPDAYKGGTLRYLLEDKRAQSVAAAY